MDSITAIIQIPNGTKGLIIGRHGKTVKDIQSKTNTLIRLISYRNHETMQEAAIIYGLRLNVEKAKISIMNVFQDKFAEKLHNWQRNISNHFTLGLLIQIPNGLSGYVIGAHGKTIHGIESQTKTKIQVIKYEDQGKTNEAAIITGSYQNTIEAKEVIQSVIGNGTAKLLSTKVSGGTKMGTDSSSSVNAQRIGSLKFGLWNAQSLRNKTQLVSSYMNEKELDVYFIVESWLSEDDSVVIGELENSGKYRLINKPRPNRNGGGVCCIHRSPLKVIRVETMNRMTMEVLEVTIESNGSKLSAVTVYRPGSSNKNKYHMNDFFAELTEMLAHYSNYKNEVIFIGDFNIHVNDHNNSDAKRLLALLEMFEFNQHIHEPTHKNGNTLDLVITKHQSMVKFCEVDELNSDHMNILIEASLEKPKSIKKRVKTRKFKDINMDSFKKDLQKCLRMLNSPYSQEGLDSLLSKYQSIKDVLDKHAPTKEFTVTDRKPTPWSSSDIKSAKAEKRKLEKRWRKTKSQIDYLALKEQKNKYNNLLQSLRSKQISDIISKNRKNPKLMFKSLNSALHRKVDPPLPPNDDESTLAEEFSEFFDEKIEKIRLKLDQNEHQKPVELNGEVNKPLLEFKMVTEDEVKKILQKMSKSCQLDPIPMWLAKECMDEILPIITQIINRSLSLGEVPVQMKHAIIKPLLKKLNSELICKNYRPVSNLPFLSKILEACVIKQFLDHLTENDLHDKKQSAYKKYHSTETLLLKIHNDIMTNLNKGEVAMLVMLDLSAAFDTIDHHILLERLEKLYGIKGTVLKWFKSYLTNRTQSVVINEKESSHKLLKYGVPQGSKLGPILFNAYIAPLSNIPDKHGVSDEKYADDEQLLLSFKPTKISDQNNAVAKMENCINDIRKFLLDNKLCNNDEKTEFMIIGCPQQIKKIEKNFIQVHNVKINAADKVKNLGVLFDKTMTMESQVNFMCKKVFLNLKNISMIRKSLNKEDTKVAVNALVTPHLDYGNALLCGINQKYISKLQIAQNSAARLIERLKKHDHISHVRKELHWLPVSSRIKFKLLNMTWKALNSQAPPYVMDLLRPRVKTETNLRNNNKILLHHAPSNNRYGARAFSFIAPLLWNELPEDIKLSSSNDVFKRRLKTHLFKTCYGC